MKVLFLCRGNVGRSVFAEKIFNKLTNSDIAFSAGTRLSGPEETLESLLPKTIHVINVMELEGIDVTKHIRRSVTEDMIKNADVVIDMSEQETVSDYVVNHPNRIIWKIKDPKGTDLDTHLAIKDEIKGKITNYIQNVSKTAKF